MDSDDEDGGGQLGVMWIVMTRTEMGFGSGVDSDEEYTGEEPDGVT